MRPLTPEEFEQGNTPNPTPERVCLYCGTPIAHKPRRAFYCSKAHRMAAFKQLKKQRYSPPKYNG